jgi:hypothetical protein
MPAKKKRARKRLKSKRAASKKTTSRKTRSSAKRPARRRERASGRSFSRQRADLHSGAQSGDVQGLSQRARADSESVDELLEEGNAFEADVVQGVEAAEDADEQEVRTHEVPEDDVPGEYLDKD